MTIFLHVDKETNAPSGAFCRTKEFAEETAGADQYVVEAEVAGLQGVIGADE